MKLALLTCALCLAAAPLAAQTPTPGLPHPQTGAIDSRGDWPQPRTGDVDSIDHILAALYASISGPAAQPRDWNRFRSLLLPGARLLPVRVEPGSPDPRTMPATDVLLLSIDDYIARASAVMATQGFFEQSIHNDVSEFGGIVAVFSTYESRHDPGDAKVAARGVNAIQLLHDGGRFWIVDIFWDSERPGLALPARYLPRPQPTPTDASASLVNLVGDWVGQLQYRDFQTNARTFLPTWLSVSQAADGDFVTLDYTYDDGPGKTVRERQFLGLTETTASFTSDRDHTRETYAVKGFDDFRKLNRGTLTLTGPGTENNKPVDVRIVFTLRRNLYTYEKSTRPAGSGLDFEFRDAYTFTRIEPAR